MRLAGVLAPREEEPYGRESRAALEQLAVGQQVMLLYGGRRRDDYGRALAQVRLAKGGWLQRRMLESGAVRVRTWPDNRAMAAEMLEAEAKARNAHRGLWALPAYRVLLPTELDRQWGFQVMEGRVRGVRGAHVLLFDSGVSAVIAPDAAADFTAAGKSPAHLAGRLVRIRGGLRQGYDGPELRLDHPEQVELLQTR